MAAPRPKPLTSLKKKERTHRNLVLLELGAAGGSVWLMAATGFGIWTFSALGLAGLLMIASMVLQIHWCTEGAEEQVPVHDLAEGEPDGHSVLEALLPFRHHSWSSSLQGPTKRTRKT